MLKRWSRIPDNNEILKHNFNLPYILNIFYFNHYYYHYWRKIYNNWIIATVRKFQNIVKEAEFQRNWNCLKKLLKIIMELEFK